MQKEIPEEYVEVLDNLREGYVETGKNGNITFANLTFTRELGFEHREDLLGKHFCHFVQEEFAPGIAHKLDALLQSAQPMDQFKTRYVGKKGKSFIGEASLSPLLEGGEILGVKGTVRNVTQKVAAEKEQAMQRDFMDALLEQTPVAVVNVSKDNTVSFVNPAFQDLFGYTPEELIGKNLDELLSTPETLDQMKEYSLNRMGERLYLSGKRKKKNGTLTDVEVIAQPFFVGSINYGHLVFYIDVSIRAQAEELIKKAKEAAEERAGELASINRVAEKVSHSLNLRDILLTACEELCAIFPIYQAGIALLDKQDSQLEVMAFHSTLPEEKSRQGKILFLEGEGCLEVQHLIKAKKSLRIKDAQGDPLLKPLHNLFGRSATGSFMVVPLINRGRTLGIIGMTLKDAEFSFKKNRVELAETVASQIATAVENAKMHAQTEHALDLAERDLEIGREIQSGFFPPHLPEVPGWELAAYFKAARQVSGDFYDVFPLENTPYVGLVVADVCDKGVGAALFMVLLRSLIRSYSEQHQEIKQPHELLHHISLKVNRYIVQTHGRSNMFATLFLSLLDPATHTLYYVNGGHDAPLLMDAAGRLNHELPPTGPAFGFSTDLDFEVASCVFSPGDLLFTYTDGITEAKNQKGSFYTEKRLVREAGKTWPSAYSALKHLELDLASHMGDQLQFDDMTLLALRRKQDKEPDAHLLLQKAVLPNLPRFRNFVAEVCSDWKVDKGVSENLQLAVDELCSNLILHGYEGREAGDIVLSIKKRKASLQVELEDSGRSYDPSFLDPPHLGDDIKDRKMGGLGVFLVRELVDDLSYESGEGRNRLVLSMKF